MSFVLFYGWVVFYCRHVICLLYPVISWWTFKFCLHVLAIVNSAAMNTRMHESFWNVVFSRYMPINGMTGSYANFIFSFLRNLHTDLHSAVYCAKSLQWYLTLCNPMDCSPQGSSVHGSLQARIQEWVATPSSRGSSRPRDRILISYVSCVGRQVLYH